MIENILALALTVVPKQEALLFRWLGRETNNLGFDVDTFAPPVSLTGSIQPIDRSRYGYMGLDAIKDYRAVYSTELAKSLTKTENPDHIEYMGRRYRIMNDADWHAPADYNGLMGVDIGPATGATEVQANDTHGE